MTIRNPDSIFEYDDADPGATESGSKATGAKTWKYCPYSTQTIDFNQDSRVPDNEKVYHPETEGRMHSYSVIGVMGWVCADNACPYFLSTASTEVDQYGRVFVAASGTRGTEEGLATLSGSAQSVVQSRAIVSGTRQRYYEI